MRRSNRHDRRSQRTTPPDASGERPAEEGAVAVEFAAVAILFIGLLYGMMAFGLVFGLNHSMTHAASEGARAALTAPAGDEVDAARAAAEDRMSWLGTTDGLDIHVDLLDECPNDSDASCIEVEVAYDYGGHPIIPNLPGLGVVLPDEMVRHAVLQVTQ